MRSVIRNTQVGQLRKNNCSKDDLVYQKEIISAVQLLHTLKVANNSFPLVIPYKIKILHCILLYLDH